MSKDAYHLGLVGQVPVNKDFGVRVTLPVVIFTDQIRCVMYLDKLMSKSCAVVKST